MNEYQVVSKIQHLALVNCLIMLFSIFLSGRNVSDVSNVDVSTINVVLNYVT